MTALVTIDRNTHAPTPADGLIRAWATETLAASSRGRVERPEICIRITDTEEAAHFNKVYRSKPRQLMSCLSLQISRREHHPACWGIL